ncbi:hypothetical protein NCER_102142 [Vairimorpha ceranae BRL01]|uniref:Pyrimidine 5-nucleotidase n=2 Tax=Vairimorpha ceranae TaxID=40302 RepID=C4VBH4_VAIC1|nr:hypothetical protein NCER_102142 [Vairimorpha ceranae BRL01]
MKIVKTTDNIKSINTSIYDKEDKCIIFDIDDTLYKENHDLVSARRMAGYNYLNKDLKISFDEYFKLSNEYTKTYGTNYKGFLTNFKINNELIKGIDNICGKIHSHFTDYSATVNLLKKISISVLDEPGRVRIFCFSNSNSKQSEYVLNVLGISPYIDTLICVGYLPNKEVICKPMPEAYNFVNHVVNKNRNKIILFFDDNLKNVNDANRAGWIGIKVDDANDIEKIVEKAMEKYFK